MAIYNEALVDVSGSVEISKGYYSDGSNKINMPASTYNFDALTDNQTLGGKNKLFAYTDSTDSVGALITSTTPTGSFKITKELEQPVYIDPTKNYIAGGELIEPTLSFKAGTTTLWERPNLTSNTSYGIVSDVWGANNSGDYSAWKALDGNTSTYASLNDGAGGVVWWKWELPHDLIFTPESVLTFVQRNSSEGCAGWRFYADVEMTKPLGPFFTSQTSAGTSINIPCSNLASNLRTNIIYLYNPSVSSWPGMAELRFSNVYMAGESSVSSTKALQYSESQDTVYWIPSEATVSLDSVKATQSVGPVNDLYLTTTTGTPTASLSFSDNGAIAGVTTKLPLKQKVYLNNEADKILGVQERPDELVITGGTMTSYTTTGSPTITDDYVVSGLSSSNYLSRPIDTTFSPGSSAWEIKAKVTTGTSLGSEEIFIDPNSNQRGIRIGFQNKNGLKWQFLVSRGSAWISTSAYYGSYLVQPNTTYWIKAGYTGSEYYLEYSTDGSEYIRDITYSSSYAVGSYALQIRAYSNYSWSGLVDLKETAVTIGSEVWWKPVTFQDGVTVSGWSALYSDVTGFTGNIALDYTTPVNIASSSLEIPAGFGTWLEYLYYTNGDIKCIQAGDTVLDKAVFTGYALTLSRDGLQSVSKQGELCAAFVQRGYGRNTRRYLFIPAANLREGSYTTKASSGFYDMSVQGTLPPDNMIASMKNVEYNSSTATVVMEGNTFDYIGNMMCTLI